MLEYMQSYFKSFGKIVAQLNDCSSFFNNLLVVVFSFTLISQTSCKKFIEVEEPVTSTNAGNVYTVDATAASVLTGIYTQISKSSFPNGGITSLSLFPGLSADELTVFSLSNTRYPPYYLNSLLDNTGSDFWTPLYQNLYIVNAALEGLKSANELTPSVKRQLLGEASFLRAFFYFYLTNLYGDVPLALTSDYKINSQLTRASKGDVFNQIIQDLSDAKNLLDTNFLKSDIVTKTDERLRPSKWAAMALLSRVYLYVGDWQKSEAEASSLINSSLFGLSNISSAFLKNSKEAIWQLQPVNAGQNTQDARLFILPTSGPNTSTFPVYISKSLINNFEPGDQRKVKWLDSVVVASKVYYYPYKYKIATLNSPVNEYLTVFRLAEQYLIRAEARAQQNNLNGAKSDLDAIRVRAGLPNTLINDKDFLLAAILNERKVEFFTEWGHRWFDLKRTAKIDEVMSSITPIKGGTWETTDQLYPIPILELQKAPQIEQNPGY